MEIREEQDKREMDSINNSKIGHLRPLIKGGSISKIITIIIIIQIFYLFSH